MSEPCVLRVFVASPDDVAEERNTLAKLLADINDVLAYLARFWCCSMHLDRKVKLVLTYSRQTPREQEIIP
jgi:hypothetical protein